MKQFNRIFKFEFCELVKTKAYKLTTILFIIIAVIGLCLPMFIPSIVGGTSDGIEKYKEKETFAIYDKEGTMGDQEVFNRYFPNTKFKMVNSEKEVNALVKKEKVDAGFVLTDALHYKYFVYNSSAYDSKPAIFSEALTLNYRNLKFAELGVDAKNASLLTNVQAEYKVTTLGSDGAKNIIYTFLMIMSIYMIVILYGNTIASNVASEKGNRTMELLVTSANSTALIFGKVLAGCAAAFLQLGLFIATAKIMYTINGDIWNGMLDIIFNIPVNVLVTFILFGIFGFIFYAFIFGALGALVSKSEDVNSSSTPITMALVVVYFIVYIGVNDASSLIFTIASFVPFSSPMTMASRMAMVDVPLIEVIISFLILIVSTGVIGLCAAKIYRRATLMYGNQIKAMQSIKWLIKKD